MTFTPPNGCAYCGLEQYRHGSRFDGLHPRGIIQWTAPSDSVRLARMQDNRRERSAMLRKIPENMVGMWVTYYGSTDEWWGKDFQIIDHSKASSNAPIRIAFMVPGKSEPVWRTLGNSFSSVFTKRGKDMSPTTFANPDDDDFSQAVTDFLEPHKSSIEALDAEAARLRERLAEIETARKVLKSL